MSHKPVYCEQLDNDGINHVDLCEFAAAFVSFISFLLFCVLCFKKHGILQKCYETFKRRPNIHFTFVPNSKKDVASVDDISNKHLGHMVNTQHPHTVFLVTWKLKPAQLR